MITNRIVRSLGYVACAGLIACQPAATESNTSAPVAVAPQSATSTSREGGDAVAARIGSRTILVSEVDALLESELARLEVERYRARKGKLDEMINEELVNQKAKELGMTAEELAEQEIASKIEPPDEESVKEYFERFKAQGQGQEANFEELAPRIRQALSQQAMVARQSEYLASLRKEAKVELGIEPPRINVQTAGGLISGPKDAPIELVEFSDYQCPFCARSQATVKEVLEQYEGKIRHVFMDFPLDRIHPQARPAAVAARCADEQGKFWEYHNVLYDKQRELSPDKYKAWAEEISLDGEKFASCLDSGKHDAVIGENLAAGQKAGVTGTPGFFVNGILINGAQPFDVFKETIDEELARTGG